MFLYLARHGQAEHTGGDDRFRQLTERGRADVGHLQHALTRSGVHVETVYHSGLVRARQTAEILHEAVGGQIESVSGLSPADDVASAARRFENASQRSLMLVGHLPFMSRMASYLLTRNADADFIHFRTASIACLSGVGKVWQLEWFIEPHVL
jgi:phosphohistidine phosphatase